MTMIQLVAYSLTREVKPSVDIESLVGFEATERRCLRCCVGDADTIRLGAMHTTVCGCEQAIWLDGLNQHRPTDELELLFLRYVAHSSKATTQLDADNKL